jgi:hypothetical protein
MNLTDEERADVVRTLREAAERMVVHSLSGICSALSLCHTTFETKARCNRALDWLRADSTHPDWGYWYAAPCTEHKARAFALDMLASIIEAGDSLE